MTHVTCHGTLPSFHMEPRGRMIAAQEDEPGRGEGEGGGEARAKVVPGGTGASSTCQREGGAGKGEC